MGEAILRENGYRYVRMSSEDIPEVAFFIALNHLTKVSMVNYLDIPFKVCLDFAFSYLSNERVHRYAVKVMPEDRNELLGAVIGVPGDVDSLHSMAEETLRRYDPYLKFVSYLYGEFFNATKLKPEKTIRMNFIRVLPVHEGKRVMQRALKCMEIQAKQDGYACIYADAVTAKGQISIKKYGYNMVISKRFQDFESDEVKPFSGLEGSVEIIYKLLCGNYRL